MQQDFTYLCNRMIDWMNHGGVLYIFSVGDPEPVKISGSEVSDIKFIHGLIYYFEGGEVGVVINPRNISSVVFGTEDEDEDSEERQAH